MEIYARICRVGINYKLNSKLEDGNYENQFKDELSGYNPLYTAYFGNYEELDKKVKELCGGEDRFEYELTKNEVEDLMVFGMHSKSDQANKLMLACRDAFRALREGYRIVYESGQKF